MGPGRLLFMIKAAGKARQRFGAIAAFVRFVACGGSVTVLSGAALVMVADVLPLVIANAVLTVAGTVVTTELNARFAFRSGPTGLAAHVQAAGTVLVAFLFTTGAMVTLANLDPHAGALVQQAVYLTASGVAGIGRFLFLRAFVLVGERPEAGGPAHRGAATARVRERILALIPSGSVAWRAPALP